MKNRTLGMFRWLVAGCVLLVSMASQAEADSKALVTNFYQKMFVEKAVEEAAYTTISEDYIQHNPYLESGRKPLIDFFATYFQKHPQSVVEVKRVIAEDDLVVVHSHWRKAPKDRGSAVIDIFRVEGDKIVEHWDAIQTIPESAANQNSMF